MCLAKYVRYIHTIHNRVVFAEQFSIHTNCGPAPTISLLCLILAAMLGCRTCWSLFAVQRDGEHIHGSELINLRWLAAVEYSVSRSCPCTGDVSGNSRIHSSVGHSWWGLASLTLTPLFQYSPDSLFTPTIHWPLDVCMCCCSGISLQKLLSTNRHFSN